MVFTPRKFAALNRNYTGVSGVTGRVRSCPSQRRRALAAVGVASLLTCALPGVLRAQIAAPVIIPSTITTVVGNSPVATTASSACPTNAQYTATDAVGDGCPAVNATLATPTNITVDPAGNIYISSSASTNAVRRVDARTGIITAYAGITTSQCASSGGVKIYGTTAVQIDKTGDGCPVEYTGAMNTVSNLGRDPYGNILLGSKDVIIHMACNAVSPLCTAASVGENVMIGVAGCTDGKTTNFGTTVTGTTPGSAGDGLSALQTASGTCNVGVGTVIYGITADKWDNVYFMDGSNGRIRVVAGATSVTINGTSYTNPLYATLATSTGSGINYSTAGTSPLGVHQGYIYPIAGGGTVCTGKTDAAGDGCPFYQTVVYTSSTGADVQGLTTDPEGDFIFADGLGNLRVIYMGGQVIKGALSANGMASPVVGNSYLLLGSGTAYNYNSSNPGILKGTAGGLQSHAIQTLATDPAGNILIGDQEQILFYDLATGYFRRLGTSYNTTSCNSTTKGDGCNLNPAGTSSSTGAVVGAANGVLSLGEDALGNLYVLDAASLLVRRVAGASLPTSAVNGSLTTNLLVHAPTTGSSVALTPASSSDVSVGTPACVTNTSSDKSVDCTATVTYTPKLLAQRTAPLTIATTISGTTTSQTVAVNGLSTGSALVFDTANAPLVGTLGATATGNTAVVLDGDGNAYVYGTQGISKVSGSNVTNITSAAAAYIAVDPAGNVYAANAAATSLTEYAYAAGSYGSGTTISLPTLSICSGTSSPAAYSCASATQTYTGPFVVDAEGVIYVADTTNKQLFKFTPSPGLVQQLTQTALTSPTKMAQDSYGNLLVVDGTSVLKIPSSGFAVSPSSPYANPTVSFSPSLTAPTSVAADQGGNVYVADNGLIKVSAFSGGSYTIPTAGAISPSAPTAASAGTASTTTLTPANATDTLAGTLAITVGSGSAYSLTVASGTALSALATQINGNSTLSGESVTAAVSAGVLTISGPATAGSTLATTGTSLTDTAFASGTTALAVDGAGNLYAVQNSVAGITEIVRNAESFAFGTNQTETYVGVLANAGATAPTGFTQTDTAGDFTVGAPASALAASASTCNLASTILSAGTLCNASFNFTPTANGTGTVSDAISLTMAGTTNTLGSVTVSGYKSGTSATTTTSITGNTAGLVYSTGTETTFTVTVSESPAAVPAGTVAVTIDNGTPVNYTLTGATSSTSTATVTIAGLTATSTTPHTIVATYAGSTGITSSTSSTTSFSIAQATPTLTWTPSATTQSYSAPISPILTPVLNASAGSGGSSVGGVYVYTANGSEINAATYLPIGSYTLGVTFYPTDSTDYTGSSLTLASNGYTVTKATTTAPIGATQLLVAPVTDGSGNYTSVQAAINVVGASGGSVYIKPGTYTGDVSVTQPNVALRGLGGDPTKVILTHESGAFSSSSGTVYSYAGEFNTSYTNGYQLPTGSTLFNSVANDAGSATLVVAAGVNTAYSTTKTYPNNFYAEYLTLQNTYDTDTQTMTTTYVPAGGSVCTAGNATPYTYYQLYTATNSSTMPTLCASQALAIWITADTAVLNNVYTASSQDTVYAGSISTGSHIPARQFWFRGEITGNVDYIFGDAAAVFDHTSIYTTWKLQTAASGTETIEAQNKASQTGGSGDYLSGYVMNSDVFTSQSSGMSGLDFGRPYGTYSTWIMLNSQVDQVNSIGYIPFGGSSPNLQYATYGEYNDSVFTDPANGATDANGVVYNGTGGSSGSGVLPTSARENGESPMSTDPGYVAFNFNSSNAVGMTQAQAQQFYPINFLGKTVTIGNGYNTVANWDPTLAIASDANAFVPSSSPSTVAADSSITLLMRPQTPGLGAITNGTYTIPTGTYTLSDTYNGTTAVLASGPLDASGEAYYTTTSLGVGAHSFSWSYSGDSNFSGSTTGSAYSLTVTGNASTAVLATTNITYGQSATVTETVTAANGGATPTGNVSITIVGTSGTTTQTAALSSGVATFTLANLTAGSYSITSNSFSATGITLSVAQAPLLLTGVCANRAFDAPNSCSAPTLTGSYQYADTAATVFSGALSTTTSAPRNSPAGSYAATPVYTLTTFGNANYLITTAGSFTVSGGAPQTIVFGVLPAFPAGTYQLTAHATSGLPVSYSVTGAGASISGSTLTLSGATGNTITVTASTPADPTGDYATATTVSRSFTAQ